MAAISTGFSSPSLSLADVAAVPPFATLHFSIHRSHKLWRLMEFHSDGGGRIADTCVLASCDTCGHLWRSLPLCRVPVPTSPMWATSVLVFLYSWQLYRVTRPPAASRHPAACLRESPWCLTKPCYASFNTIRLCHRWQTLVFNFIAQLQCSPTILRNII